MISESASSAGEDGLVLAAPHQHFVLRLLCLKPSESLPAEVQSALLAVTLSIFFAFNQWQGKQDDDDDFFDTYDSRRVETLSNRNRDDGGRLGEITGRSIG